MEKWTRDEEIPINDGEKIKMVTWKMNGFKVLELQNSEQKPLIQDLEPYDMGNRIVQRNFGINGPS